MNIIITPLDRAAVSELSRIDAVCFSEPWSEKTFRDASENPLYRFYTAIDGGSGEVVGYAGMYSVIDEGEITNVAVLPRYRRKGIAASLLDKLIFDAISRKITVLRLEVRASNETARILYESKGFTAEGSRKKYYRNPAEDAVLMTRYL